MSKKDGRHILSIVADNETHKRLQRAADAEDRSKGKMGLILIKKALDELPIEEATHSDRG